MESARFPKPELTEYEGMPDFKEALGEETFLTPQHLPGRPGEDDRDAKNAQKTRKGGATLDRQRWLGGQGDPSSAARAASLGMTTLHRVAREIPPDQTRDSAPQLHSGRPD